MSVGIEVIVTARAPMPAAYAFRGTGPRALQAGRLLGGALLGRGPTLDAPCLSYVVRHPDAGTLLIDTGMHADVATDLRKDFGTAMSVLFRSMEPAPEPYDDQLRRHGVDPAAVERVVMTHLHVDHTSGMRLLPAARFVCTDAEWRAAIRDKGYVRHHLPPEDRMELVSFGDAEPHGPFSRTIDLLGDGSVRLISTPGHTPGHLSVLLRAAGDHEVLVVGDAAYTLRSIRDQTLPLFTAGDERYAASLREIGAYVQANPDAVVVPTHDPSAWEKVRGLPARAPA